VTVVLDSWAVLRWLEGIEPVAGRVETVVADHSVMSWINLGEVFEVVWRASGAAVARRTVSDIRARVLLDDATPERVLAAARIKAEYPMALGDAFVAATAVAHDAAVLTGAPELLDRRPLAGRGFALTETRVFRGERPRFPGVVCTQVSGAPPTPPGSPVGVHHVSRHASVSPELGHPL
jgi:predicted nucleic acid-binding protein